MYSVLATYSFEAFHSIKDVGGFAEPLHSHRFKVEMKLSSEILDEHGCVVDFSELDSKVADILGEMKRRDLGSAETIARTLHNDICQAFAGRSITVGEVTVWEDDRHAGSYRRMR